MRDELIVTAQEATRLLRIAPERMQELLEAGEIPAYREGRVWKIPFKLLELYTETRAISEAKGRRENYESHEMEQK